MPIKPFKLQAKRKQTTPPASRASFAIGNLAKRALAEAEHKESEEQKEVKEPSKEAQKEVQEPKGEKPDAGQKVQEPQKPAEPSKPSQPSKPSEPSKPNKPNKPSEPNEGPTVHADMQQPPLLELRIQCRSMDAYKTLVNMLGVISWNGGVGHSAVTAGFFDGDGADQMDIEGLPPGDYKDMANALSSYGDSFMGMVGPSHALAYNISEHNEDGSQLIRVQEVYPPVVEEADYAEDVLHPEPSDDHSGDTGISGPDQEEQLDDYFEEEDAEDD